MMLSRFFSRLFGVRNRAPESPEWMNQEEFLLEEIAGYAYRIALLEEVMSNITSPKDRDAYWDLISERSQLESEYENRFGHSRKRI